MIALAALLAAPSHAEAQVGSIFQRACNTFVPTRSVFLAVSVNGICTDLSSLVVPGTKPLTATAVGSLELTGVGITFSAVWDGDPFLTFGVTTQNLLPGPIDYSFIFGTPIVPGQYPYAEGELSLSLTPGLQGSSVTNSGVSSAFLSGYGTVGPAETTLGVDRGSGTCTATSSPASCPYGIGTNTFVPTFYDNLEGMLTYTQTGLLSTATFSARVELFDEAPDGGEPGPGPGPGTVVPEPSTYALMALGLGLLGVAARCRRGSAEH